MRIIIWVAVLMLASTTAYAQLVKTIFQTFEIPDSTTLITFKIYEKDAVEVVPWAGNNIMTESNIKLYYASRGVFDHLLEKGRYNFEVLENGNEFTVKSVKERQMEIKLSSAGQEGQYGKDKSENVKVRVFIPDGFSQQSPTAWARPRKEVDEERIGAYRPRKKLAREGGTVSEELKDAIPEAPKDTVEEQIFLPLPDSTWRRQPGALDKPKKDQ